MASPKPSFAKRNPAKQMRRLVGRWTVEATFPYGEVVRGWATFRWIEKDALMLMRSKMRRLIPAAVSVLGADDVKKQLTMLYSDDRGVSRTYELKVTRTVFAFFRKAPHFHQRFVGRTVGRKIVGAAQKSATGRHWEHDFDLVYTKQR